MATLQLIEPYEPTQPSDLDHPSNQPIEPSNRPLVVHISLQQIVF